MSSSPRSLGTPRNALGESQHHEGENERRATVGDEREREAGDGHDADVHADVDDDL